jgi:hypothetical protein
VFKHYDTIKKTYLDPKRMLNLGDPTPMGYIEIMLLNHLKAESTILLSIPVLFLVLKLDISTASTSSARAVVLCAGRHADMTPVLQALSLHQDIKMS